ncbi:hypothetical protein BJY00DRAFT_315514 [Aspergillus carlsbadensis]|nr:hypothetical protein BJY00DRAFT_315514 [Aspergillus carlsbadensis]
MTVAEIWWRKPVSERIVESVNLVPLPLWGKYKDVTLPLEYDNSKFQDLLLTVAVGPGGIAYDTGLYKCRHSPGAYGRISAAQKAVKERLTGEALAQMGITSPELFKEMETRRASSLSWDALEYAPEIERTVAPVAANTTAQGGFSAVISYDTDMRRLNDSLSALSLALTIRVFFAQHYTHGPGSSILQAGFDIRV